MPAAPFRDAPLSAVLLASILCGGHATADPFFAPGVSTSASAIYQTPSHNVLDEDSAASLATSSAVAGPTATDLTRAWAQASLFSGLKARASINTGAQAAGVLADRTYQIEGEASAEKNAWYRAESTPGSMIRIDLDLDIDGTFINPGDTSGRDAVFTRMQIDALAFGDLDFTEGPDDFRGTFLVNDWAQVGRGAGNALLSGGALKNELVFDGDDTWTLNTSRQASFEVPSGSIFDLFIRLEVRTNSFDTNDPFELAASTDFSNTINFNLTATDLSNPSAPVTLTAIPEPGMALFLEHFAYLIAVPTRPEIVLAFVGVDLAKRLADGVHQKIGRAGRSCS